VPAYRKSTVHALEIGLGLGNILQVWIISYMEITYFHLLCNYLQNYILIKIPPPPLSPPQKSLQHIFIPNSAAVSSGCIYELHTTGISRYSKNGSNNRHADI